jgi:lipopolysaccharide transport system ATP-binding protein
VTADGDGLGPDEMVRVDAVSKKFTSSLRRSLAYGLVDLGRNLVGVRSPTDRLRRGEFWAVDTVSFALRRGESVGIVGSNGAGKTTLLRLLAGIYPPDRGTVRVRGRVSALIAIGTGFHPHLSGRENIYLNGALLGLTQGEIDERLDDITAFAELGDFLDSPVSLYSSGMTARLGFAVSTALDPDILLLDEVLATGDIAFRQRCFRRLDEIRNRSTLILVTHMPAHIQRVCDRVIWLEHGSVQADGPTDAVLDGYSEAMRQIAQRFDSSRGDRPLEML